MYAVDLDKYYKGKDVKAPCYYHNYLLGELFASQVRHALVQNVLLLKEGSGTGLAADKRVGEFLREKIFIVTYYSSSVGVGEGNAIEAQRYKIAPGIV